MKIDNKTHKIESNNYYFLENNKTQIILSFSLRKNNHHIVRLKNKNGGNTKEWNTYTISRGGVIYEHFEPKFYSDFIGIKEADKKSISIVLENMGGIINVDDWYVNYLNEKCDAINVVEKKWLNQNHWEKFPKEQIDSLIFLVKKLCKDFKIPNKLIEFHYLHNNIAKYTGVVFKSNYFDDSNNTNPLFNINEISDLISN
jgi:hypothetical protein